jgi:hypothetical protein
MDLTTGIAALSVVRIVAAIRSGTEAAKMKSSPCAFTLAGLMAASVPSVASHRGRSRIISRFATENTRAIALSCARLVGCVAGRQRAGSSSGRKIGRHTSPIRWHESQSESVICKSSSSRFHRPAWV